VGEIVPVDDADSQEVAGAVYALFDPSAPERERKDGDWTLAPADDGEEPARLRENGAEHVLTLASAGRPRAYVAVARDQADDVNALTVAARRAGLRLVLAGRGVRLPGGADAHMPGDGHLVASVRQLQSEGAGVLVVTRHRGALAAADCGVGLTSPDGHPAWGAHLLARDDLTVAASVLDAVGAAHRVAGLGVTLARSGSGVAALLALVGPPGRAASRALGGQRGRCGGNDVRRVAGARRHADAAGTAAADHALARDARRGRPGPARQPCRRAHAR